MLAQYQYRMKIRKAENIAESSAALLKICKDRHKLANCDAVRTHHNGKIVAEASTALQHQSKLAPQSHHTLRNNGGKNYVSAAPQAGALRHIKMAWPNQRANGSVVPRDMERA